LIEKITKDKGGFKPRPRLHKVNPCTFEKIFNTLWGYEKDNYAKSTIEVTGRRLRLIAKSETLTTQKK
jgi:hypothetical protein